MSTSNRASKLTKTHKVLKKHYKPYPVADRPVLEHLLYACCLEVAPAEAADEAFAKLQQAYYDWNEVRVTTVSELSEILSGLPKSSEAASRLKRSLQSVFECYYSFDLEPLKKENIGKAVKQLEKLDGISKFAVAFVTQNGLGGHAIAVNRDGAGQPADPRRHHRRRGEEQASSWLGASHLEEQGRRIRVAVAPTGHRLRSLPFLATCPLDHARNCSRCQRAVSEAGEQEEAGRRSAGSAEGRQG